MVLYDELINKAVKNLDLKQAKIFDVKNEKVTREKSYSMIFDSDAVCEIGREPLFGTSMFAVTSSKDIVSKDEILLFGKDIDQIDKDCNYARLTFVLIDEKELTEENNKAFELIRKVELKKYRFYFKNLMFRISPNKEKETIRVGKQAKKDGVSFRDIGAAMIEDYHQVPEVKAVKIVFITKDDFDYNNIYNLGTLSEKVTDTLDHIYKNIIMDCNACKLKEVCDEVEGLREMHFKEKKN